MVMIYYTLEVGMKLDLVMSPRFLEEDTLKGCLCAVIDVLRATSTIITALASGAKEVHPCLDIEEARRGAAKMPKGTALLGGEERGERIPGFDLGNSPLEYLSADVIAGKAIYFYTTNGSGAIRKAYAGCGRPVYVAALINMSAVSSAIVKAAASGQNKGITTLCSGRYGKPSSEDNFCAGLMIDKISRGLRGVGIAPQMTDDASAATKSAAANRGHGLDVLYSSEHGRFLESLGFGDDMVFASRTDFYDVVPVFNGDHVILERV